MFGFWRRQYMFGGRSPLYMFVFRGTRCAIVQVQFLEYIVHVWFQDYNVHVWFEDYNVHV